MIGIRAHRPLDSLRIREPAETLYSLRDACPLVRGSNPLKFRFQDLGVISARVSEQAFECPLEAL